jgi:hypothetical protein
MNMDFVVTIADQVLLVNLQNIYDGLANQGFASFILHHNISNSTPKLIIRFYQIDRDWSTLWNSPPNPLSNEMILHVEEVYLRYSNLREEFITLTENRLLIYNSQNRVFETFEFVRDEIHFDQLKNCFIIFLQCLLSEQSGLIFHGAGFILAGGGGVFTGPSGAGKTTAVSLIDKEFLLSDDLVAITEINNQPIIHSTPIGGKTDGNHHAKLNAIFFLKKADTFAIRRVDRREAIERYLAEHSDYISRNFQPIVRQTFLNAYQLFEKVPAFEVSFSRDYIDPEQIRNAMRGLL